MNNGDITLRNDHAPQLGRKKIKHICHDDALRESKPNRNRSVYKRQEGKKESGVFT